MADRFPSLDEFDNGNHVVASDTLQHPQLTPHPGQTEATGGNAPSNLDEPSDFLARERAALGEDAQQFTTSEDNAATVEDGDDDDDDLLGGGMGAPSAPANNNNGDFGDFGGDDVGDFESSFPAVDTQNSAVGADGSITGSTLPFQAPAASTYQDEGEPEVLREWREKRDHQIQHRDEVSASKKAETVKAAQQNIDEFYENYNNRKDKGIAQTRREEEEFLKNREDTTNGGTSWERIAKLVDLSGKGASGGASGTQKAKMRELLIDLRKDQNAPGAGGA